MKNIERDTYSLALNIRLSSHLETDSLDNRYVSNGVTNLWDPVEDATYNNIWDPVRRLHKNDSNR
jgi:hypothetical protein